MTNACLIYPKSLATSSWVDINCSLSLALETDLAHREWRLRKVDSRFQVFCSSASDIARFHEVLVQLVDDEATRIKIPLNTLVSLEMFTAICK